VDDVNLVGGTGGDKEQARTSKPQRERTKEQHPRDGCNVLASSSQDRSRGYAIARIVALPN
jgi:hypothetical protein